MKAALVDSLVIPNVDSQVGPAICACTSVEQLNALGHYGVRTPYALPFTRRMPPAKAADVTLLEVRLGRGLGGEVALFC